MLLVGTPHLSLILLSIYSTQKWDFALFFCCKSSMPPLINCNGPKLWLAPNNLMVALLSNRHHWFFHDTPIISLWTGICLHSLLDDHHSQRAIEHTVLVASDMPWQGLRPPWDLDQERVGEVKLVDNEGKCFVRDLTDEGETTRQCIGPVHVHLYECVR
jgi:hypothetical protein